MILSREEVQDILAQYPYAKIRQLVESYDDLQRLVVLLSDRVAGQSEMLSKVAERSAKKEPPSNGRLV